MTSLPYKMIFPTRQGVTGVTRQMIFIYILVLLIARIEIHCGALHVKTGHHAPGWNGALLMHTAKMTFDNLDPGKRPLAVTADFMEIFGVSSITIGESALNRVTLLFDPDRSLEERVIGEQFAL